MLKRMLCFLMLLLSSIPCVQAEESKGQFFNPITDICWRCTMPIYFAGANTTPSAKDFINHKKALCHCPGGIVGVPVSYFEPKKIIEVTTVPFKMVAFGGGTISKTAKKRGTRHAYHVHFYTYPALQLLNLAEHYACSSGGDFSLGYMSEFDPFWFDDSWNMILHPDSVLFGTTLAHAACVPDAIFSTLHKPTDKLPWCSGSQGSLYPMNGFVNHVRGPVQASSLMVHRLLGKLHRWGWAKTFEEGNYCEKTYSMYPRKTAYKIQVALPIKQTTKKCPPLGANEYDWGFMKTYPGKGESFAYVIWERSHCCVDPYKTAKKVATGGISD